MNDERLIGHRIANALQSLLLLGGMVALLAVIADLVAGPDAIVWTLIGGAVLLLLAPRVSPRLILGLYGAREVSPREAPDLHALIAELSRRAELPRPPRLFHVPSSMLNAFTLGHREDAAIAVTDGLLRRLNGRELAGVLAHEIAHVRNNDMWIMGLADVISRMTRTFSMIGTFLLFLNLPLIMFGYYHVPWLAIAILMFSPTASALLQLALSRRREFIADLGAAELTGDPMGLAAALEKLERYQGRMWEQILLPDRRLPEPSLLRTHPPTEERIRRLMEIAPKDRRPLPPLPEDSWPHDWPRIHRPPRWHWSGIWH